MEWGKEVQPISLSRRGREHQVLELVVLSLETNRGGGVILRSSRDCVRLQGKEAFNERFVDVEKFVL